MIHGTEFGSILNVNIHIFTNTPSQRKDVPTIYSIASQNVFHMKLKLVLPEIVM